MPQKHLSSDNRIVHRLVKKTAQELAGAFYEWQAGRTKRGDDFYRKFPDLNRFVRDEWPSFVKETKKILATMLGDPMTTDIEKVEIYEALTLDATMPYSEQEVQITNFRH